MVDGTSKYIFVLRSFSQHLTQEISRSFIAFRLSPFPAQVKIISKRWQLNYSISLRILFVPNAKVQSLLFLYNHSFNSLYFARQMIAVENCMRNVLYCVDSIQVLMSWQPNEQRIYIFFILKLNKINIIRWRNMDLIKINFLWNIFYGFSFVLKFFFFQFFMSVFSSYKFIIRC